MAQPKDTYTFSSGEKVFIVLVALAISVAFVYGWTSTVKVQQ